MSADDDWTDLAAPTAQGGHADDWSDMAATSGSGQKMILPSARTAKRNVIERFVDNFHDASERGTLTGGVAGATGAAVADAAQDRTQGALYREKERDKADLYKAASEGDRWFNAGGPIEDAYAGAATLAGQFAGSLTSPESFVGAGESAALKAGAFGMRQLERLGATEGVQNLGKVAGRLFLHGGANAAVAGTTDPIVQGLGNLSGAQDGYDPGRTAASAALGFALPAGIEGLGFMGKSAFRWVGEGLNGLAKWAFPDAPPEPPRPANDAHPDDWRDLGPAQPSTPRGISFADTGALVNPAQQATYAEMQRRGEFDAAAPVGSRGLPRPAHAEYQPSPGEWYVAPDGRLTQAPPAPPESEAEITVVGKRPARAQVFSPAGKPLDVSYEVRDLGDIQASHNADLTPNPAYPAELQPRDRTRAASEAQVTSIARDLQPAMLGETPDLATGAPMVGPDGAVESGNGRLIALRRLYEADHPNAQAYRAWLSEQGYPVEGVDRPVLVRRRETELSPEERVAWAQAANERSTAAMSAPEQAKSDAGRLAEAFPEGYQGGGLDSIANAPFIGSVLEKVATPADLGALKDAYGRVSAEGLRRARAALTQHAYGDGELIARLYEDPRPELGSLGKAVQEAAPTWAGMRAAAEAGTIPRELDATPALTEALALVRQAREGKTNLRDVFSTQDAFGRDPRVEGFARLFFNDDGFSRVRSGQAAQRDLEAYATAAREAKSGALFGESGEELSTSILDGLVKRARDESARAQQKAGTGGFDFGQAAMREAPPIPDERDAVHRIDSVLASARAPGDPRHVEEIGHVAPHVAKAFREAGLPITAAWKHELPAERVRKIMRDHGDAKAERLSGQTAVTEADFRLLPEVHAAPDFVASGLRGKRNEKVIAFAKHLDDHTTAIVEYVGAKRQRLQPITMWKVPRLIDADALRRRLDLHGQTGPGDELKVVDLRGADKEPGSLAMRSADSHDWRDLGRAERPPDDWTDLGGVDKLPSRAGRGLRDAPRPQPVEAKHGEASSAAYKGKTVSQLAVELRQELGITHRQGRITMRKALGTYDLKTGVVRTKQVHELDVLTHEAFHKLEFEDAASMPALKAALKAHDAELSAMAYPGAAPGTHRQEGFAEFGRWYLTNLAHARREAPKFFGAFEAALAKDRPKLLAKLQAIQAAYQHFLSAPSAAAAAASLVTAKPHDATRQLVADLRANAKATIGSIMDRAYTAVVDDVNPLQVAVRRLQGVHERNTGAKLDLKVANDPYKLARLSRGAFAAGHQDLIHGVHPYGEVAPKGPSLAGALEKALGAKSLAFKKSAVADFGQYLASRRLVHEWERYEAGDLPKPPDRLSGAYHAQVIKDFDASHPEWDDAAADVYAWNAELWRKERDAGLITDTAYQAGLEKPDYVPLMRDMSDRDRAGGRPTRSNQRYAGGTRRFQGSTRDMLNPIQSMMKRAYDLSVVIARNDAVKALQELGEKAGRGAGEIVERLPERETKALQVDALEALKAAAHAAGADPRDVTTLIQAADAILDGHTKAKVFTAGEVNERGEPIVFVWHDGAPVPLRLANDALGRDMLDAIIGMNKEQKAWWLAFASAPARALRYGVTADPNFAAINFLRDQVATWINSDVGFVPLVHGAKGLASEVAKGDTARLYNVAGGISGGANVASLPKARLQGDVQALRSKRLTLDRVNPLKRFSELSEVSETGTRLGVFGQALKRAKARGLSEREAALEAAYIARDTLDFDRTGAQMQVLRRVLPFMNASLQGLEKAARVLSANGEMRQVLSPLWGKKPLANLTEAEQRAVKHAWRAWLKVGAIGVAGLALSAMHHGDQDYEEIDDTTRATYWIGPKMPNGDFVKIPKPFELAALSNIMERAYERVADKNPTAWGRMWKGLGDILIPAHTSPIATIPLEVAGNRDHFGKPIVPDRLRYGAKAEDQVQPTTTGLARGIGAMLHVSPAVVEYVMTSGGGGLGRSFVDVLKGMEKRVPTGADATRMPVARRLLKNPNSGATATDDFYRLTSYQGGELTRQVGSVGLRVNAGDASGAEGLIRKLQPYEREYVIATELLPVKERLNHPLVRAAAAGRVISEVRRNVQGAEIVGVDGQKVPLTADKRTELVRALENLSVVTHRNALVRAGVPGYSQMTPGNTAKAIERVRSASPEVVDILEARWSQRTRGKNGHPVAPSEEEAAREWPRIKAALASTVDTPGKLYEALRQRLFFTPDGRKNPRSKFRPGEPVGTPH